MGKDIIVEMGKDMAEVSKETGVGGGGGEEGKNEGVVRWERFLPRMVVRVLVVESDDSTRHIITALLRKCSYKVAAVSDGFKAWELLKGRPHNIDLILTEVELPSISGFALLTLVAEHEICKNIPVIMMSAHDSVSTVYKCMLRGAADFLVKPVRKNELKNLWQHVWRKQASSSGGPQATSDAQQKVEATAENNATSNHSSGYEACIQRNRDCIEKGSDAQSSCTKPDLVAEGAHLGNRKDLPHLNLITSQLRDAEMQKAEQCIEKSEQMPTHEGEAHGSASIPNIRFEPVTLKGDTAADIQCGFATDTNEALDNNNALNNSSREAIDLIGTFDSNPKCSYRSLDSNDDADRVDSSSLLDLSLRRSHPSGSVNQVMDDRHRLKQSDASAFSRYVTKTFQSPHSTSTSICNQQRGYENNSGKQIFHQPSDHNSDTRGPIVVGHDNNMISMTTGQAETQIPYSQQRVVPVTVPVRNILLESQCNAIGSALPYGTTPPVFSQQSSRSPLQSPVSSAYPGPPFQVSQTCPFNPESSSSQQLKCLMDQQIHNTSDQMEQKKGQKLESQDRQFSSATDHSGSGSFCNGSLSHFNSINSGSIGNTVSAVNVAVDNGNEVALNHNGNCNRSMLREAALTKFRLKRKDRCFDKKVRYESRKKLAEQRPRVKGQFVRQVCTDAPSIETDSHLSHQLVS